VTLIPAAEILRDLVGQAVRLGEEDSVWVLGVKKGTEVAQEFMSLGQVGA
jgi:hypothetical protein